MLSEKHLEVFIRQKKRFYDPKVLCGCPKTVLVTSEALGNRLKQYLHALICLGLEQRSNSTM